MRVVTDWINDHLSQKLAVNQLAEAMELAGVEVEEIIEPSAIDDRVIAAKITGVEPHPNADKLRLATVDTGSEKLDIVCGAPNIEEGQIVPLAQVGARLPDGTKIGKTSIRGQDSAGMLLSPKELGVGDDHSGILVLSPDVKPGSPLHKLYSHNQTVLDIKTAANRPDLVSIVGLAREVAAHSQADLKPASGGEFQQINVGGSHGDKLFKLAAKDAVERYSGAKIRLKGDISESAEWMRQRLLLSGVRPINLVVDITNYVMLETGQPMHAFDADKLHGKLAVRFASKSETLTTLDGVERSLTNKDLVIADSRGPVALAGVMGGESTEISSQTKSLLVETATFASALTRKTAARHNVRTESSSRFEKGLPIQFVVLGLERFIELLGEHTEAEVELIEDEIITEQQRPAIAVSAERFSRLSKLDVTDKTIKESLSKLGFQVDQTAKSSDELKVVPPYWRPDIRLEEDVFEEVIKLVGLDKVPSTLPPWQPSDVQADRFWPRYWRLRNVLSGLGLHEVTTYPFVSEKQLVQLGYAPNEHLKLQNPRSEEQAYLRRNLLPSLLAAVANNTRRRDSFGLFEVAKVYLPADTQLPQEPMKVGVVLQTTDRAYPQIKNVFDQLGRVLGCEYDIKTAVKYSFAHPGRQADIQSGGKPVGYIAQIHPAKLADLKIRKPVSYLELDLAEILAGWGQTRVKPLPRFQPATRDITVLVPRHTPWLDIRRSITDSGLASPEYRGDYYGKDIGYEDRALTIGLKIYGAQQTLTDQEANQRVEEVLKLLDKTYSARIKEN